MGACWGLDCNGYWLFQTILKSILVFIGLWEGQNNWTNKVPPWSLDMIS